MGQPSQLVAIITAQDLALRNRSVDEACRGLSREELLAECQALDTLRRESANLYERVRAASFLYAIYRFHLPERVAAFGAIPYKGYTHLLERRFEEAIDLFLAAQRRNGPSDGLCSALAAAYHSLTFQTLADQVRRSVRSVRGNQWMFRMGHPLDHPLRVRAELLQPDPSTGAYPLLRERTPVRMDLSHSGWSDIFFLGMDFPEGARVLNVSIDLAVRGRNDDGSAAPRPPVEAYFRVIDEPVIRLVSVDLATKADLTALSDVFDFARDYLGLLKAALIASGIVPPGIEGAHESLQDLLARLVGPGKGIELVSRVTGIPRGSRLAVSTTLLAALITTCMRATGQASSLTGPLAEHERRIVAARAILGEWIGGSGGGWQDSGGVWPGIKLISGVIAGEQDPEYGISRGRLLPQHRILGPEEVSSETRQRLQESLVLVHGGMAQDVGPILEMVTEKYLLRSEPEWSARQQAIAILDEILDELRRGDIRAIAASTTRNFFGPIQTIIPWATNLYTETLIERTRARFGDAFWGFWMLGGMSGGGMGFIFDPQRRQEAQEALASIMAETKRELERAIPFAMEPVVYDFSINERGTTSDLLTGAEALLPLGYYGRVVPELLQRNRAQLTPARRAELDLLGTACRTRPEMAGMVQLLFDTMFPQVERESGGSDDTDLATYLRLHGFDRAQHERIREELRAGRIGLAQNRLPISTEIRDAAPGDVIDATDPAVQAYRALGEEALRQGQVAVVTLAGGVGSRWTHGAGVVKALNPFCRLAGARGPARHRSFIEVHLAKSRRTARLAGTSLPHLITTSYLTHSAIADYLRRVHNYGYPGPLILSPGRAVGLRLVPMVRDLRFAWEELPQQLLDEQAQKVRESLHNALIEWARGMGEGSDYTDNLPMQCLSPAGHWYEIPNLFRNGVLARLLADRPQLRYLMMHNIDTLGVNVDPSILGLVIAQGTPFAVEVISRRIDDRGGGLARVNGQLRLLEGLAVPREEDEFSLTYYNSNTFWLEIDALLELFELDRQALNDAQRVDEAVRRVAARMPTYITLKDVKKRWGHGQEDVFPVAQYEKLWGDMTALPEFRCSYLLVPRMRGQQLKEVAQLDGWLRDGSAEYVTTLGDW
ncbi:MAG: UTP--glucose-1-phosphate uridylyltransferase [Chloroflexi bacterium]|nr:UTP--glucose-1-phosphate uridylyltransferase [Chloroflexota bacterium]